MSNLKANPLCHKYLNKPFIKLPKIFTQMRDITGLRLRGRMNKKGTKSIKI
jgi:hypothetical protein